VPGLCTGRTIRQRNRPTPVYLIESILKKSFAVFLFGLHYKGKVCCAHLFGHLTNVMFNVDPPHIPKNARNLNFGADI
jgi:hypothetical protein